MNNENYIYNLPSDSFKHDQILYKKTKDYKRLNPSENCTIDTLESIVPSCYRSIEKTVIKVDLLHDETLFYIFYNNTGDQSQLDAYKELINRKYYFHKKVGFFVTLTSPKIVDNKRHVVVFFNCYTWCKENVAVWFDNDFIEALCE